MKVESIKNDPKTFNDYYEKISMISRELPYDFRKRLRYLRECSGFTRERLEEFSYVSVQTIKEIENNENRGYSIETLIALCIGMRLSPFFSFDLLKVAGFDIENNMVRKNCIYAFVLRNFYDASIDEVNEFLKINHLSELTTFKEEK